MQAYRLETTIPEDNTLTLQSLPFQAGEMVEVIILSRDAASSTPRDRYRLRGIPVTYVNPTEPVAQGDWEAVR